MLVVPLKGDKICTLDDSDPKVVTSYTSLKDEPAVYVSTSTSKEPYIYFADIAEINGVKVEFKKDSKVFETLGPLRRKLNLPQPGDKVKINLIDVPFKKEDESFTVESLKLHSKKYGIARGLLVCSEESSFPLSELLDIEREEGNEPFNAKRFQKLYLDYLPYKSSKKTDDAKPAEVKVAKKEKPKPKEKSS
jgi:hypothetical protein